MRGIFSSPLGFLISISLEKPEYLAAGLCPEKLSWARPGAEDIISSVPGQAAEREKKRNG